MQRQMIQYLTIEELNILSDYNPIFLCLRAKSGVMPNIGNNYLYQGILPFEKPETFFWKPPMKDKFVKKFCLTASNR